jgi:hypothetical protein
MAQLDLPSIDEHEVSTILAIRNTPWFPKEVLANLERFSIGYCVTKNDNDCYYPISYDGSRLKIQTPIMQCMFGVQKYRNPGSTTTKYSIHLSLRTNTPEQKEFADFLRVVDREVMSRIDMPPETYYSCIRHNHANPNLPPVVRVKIPSTDNLLNIELYHNESEYFDPSYETAQQILTHKTNVQCILELQNVWVAGNKWGVSYKLLQAQTVHIVKGPLFR